MTFYDFLFKFLTAKYVANIDPLLYNGTKMLHI